MSIIREITSARHESTNEPTKNHRRRSSVNFRGQEIFARKYVWKINEIPEFYMILVRKISKIPEFLWYLLDKLTKFPNFTRFFARKIPAFYITIGRKIFSRIWGKGVVPPVSYAYGTNSRDHYTSWPGEIITPRTMFMVLLIMAAPLREFTRFL